MSEVLTVWNRLPALQAVEEILDCCGSTAWARELVARRPLENESCVIAASDEVWSRLGAQDWTEAFSKHPRIGERKAPRVASLQSAAWSAEEQQNVAASKDEIQSALADANQEYERRFGRVFIVCATGKSASEMLGILRRRLRNNEELELREAAEEQRKITNIRLKKWLSR
jgi:2-oxo-4-hydroxy-4-carboxy-5-ureidoimidazoline decarboxylase